MAHSRRAAATEATPGSAAGVPYSLIRLRPHADTVLVSSGASVLATETDGAIRNRGERGLFVHDTRLLSRYEYTIDGRTPRLSVQSNVQQRTWLAYYIANSRAPGRTKQATRHTVELRLSRCVGGGLHEDVDLTNFAQHTVRLTLALRIDGDFADVNESAGRRRQRGRIRRSHDPDAAELRPAYSARHRFRHQGLSATEQLERGVIVRIENAASPAVFDRRGVRFVVVLAPHARWHACVKAIPLLAGRALHPERRCRALGSARPRETATLRTRAADPLSGVAARALACAASDLTALRLVHLARDRRSWIPAAGVPNFVGLFGRDVMVTAEHAAVLSGALMRSALDELPRWQGRECNAWRDEEPGRMLHEAHTGPLAMLCFTPQRRYYGSLTASARYVVLLGQLWRWTGDRAAVRRHLPAATRALAWLETRARDSSAGFYRYRRRSSQGLKNQFWKDSNDAVVSEDGALVPDPIAICEAQGGVYLAKRTLAELLYALGERDSARCFGAEARELRARFNDVFWMPDRQFFAMGLDPDGRQIRSIGSDPAHCLASGIVDPALAAPVAERLLAPDLFTGWGVRTLSANHPAYSPYAYHRGSVWPVDQAFLATGLARYGLISPLHRLARALFEAAALFDHCRLPELFAGHARDAAHPFPGLYPRANWPQAWSASAPLHMVEALLGLRPFAPARRLYVDPHLPDWLPLVTVEGLQVGAARAAIRFARDARGVTRYEVLALDGQLDILHRPLSADDDDDLAAAEEASRSLRA